MVLNRGENIYMFIIFTYLHISMFAEFIISFIKFQQIWKLKSRSNK